MFITCRHEYKFTRTKVTYCPIMKKFPFPGNDNIDFISGMGLLFVGPPGAVYFNFQGTMLEQSDKFFSGVAELR